MHCSLCIRFKRSFHCWKARSWCWSTTVRHHNLMLLNLDNWRSTTALMLAPELDQTWVLKVSATVPSQYTARAMYIMKAHSQQDVQIPSFAKQINHILPPFEWTTRNCLIQVTIRCWLVRCPKPLTEPSFRMQYSTSCMLHICISSADAWSLTHLSSN